MFEFLKGSEEYVSGNAIIFSSTNSKRTGLFVSINPSTLEEIFDLDLTNTPQKKGYLPLHYIPIELESDTSIHNIEHDVIYLGNINHKINNTANCQSITNQMLLHAMAQYGDLIKKKIQTYPHYKDLLGKDIHSHLLKNYIEPLIKMKYSSNTYVYNLIKKDLIQLFDESFAKYEIHQLCKLIDQFKNIKDNDPRIVIFSQNLITELELINAIHLEKFEQIKILKENISKQPKFYEISLEDLVFP